MDSDDLPQLSRETLAALEEFYQERAERELVSQNAVVKSVDKDIEEDWQLSQFWYDENTINRLVAAITSVKPNAKVALVSCPSLYAKMQEAGHKVTLFEYDQRFSIYEPNFIFYDYKFPLAVPENLAGTYDVVLADPPFLSDECLTKTAITVRLLTKEKVVLCTGDIMGNLAEKLLAVKKCKFKPTHARNLANEFCCYINFDSELLNDDTPIQ